MVVEDKTGRGVTTIVLRSCTTNNTYRGDGTEAEVKESVADVFDKLRNPA